MTKIRSVAITLNDVTYRHMPVGGGKASKRCNCGWITEPGVSWFNHLENILKELDKSEQIV